jgi:hypothetical protein
VREREKLSGCTVSGSWTSVTSSVVPGKKKKKNEKQMSKNETKTNGITKIRSNLLLLQRKKKTKMIKAAIILEMKPGPFDYI